ncbi:MAG TPA: hypothetical protein VFS87_07805 [Qipengyuania sp.]|nr:hypothetical protein [Qipengyuania sp.]
MICFRHAAAVAMFALAAACSDADEAGAPPATPDEQRALAEARAMIPADEISPTPTPEETPLP